ncbi:unnamed protein product [Rhizophagus irregularis]|nr:unnamed protein product [Rhizophagus irregularis]CAB5361927.1 unnamed protein product [Rhizophagus irregularis]
MNLWVENVTAGGVILTDLLIKEKARTFSEAFNIQEEDLSFSNGWLYKFKKRNNIRKYRILRELGSAPLASLPEERARLQEVLGRYSLDCIYNIDEMGLFYRTDKLKPWVIGNLKRLRPLSKVNLERLPVYYRENQTSRGHGGRVDESRGRGGHSRSCGGRSRGRRGHSGNSYRDGSGGHQPDISQIQLTHVEVVFVPPNTTSHLQPLDAGIIASFKNYFKRKFCRHMLDFFEKELEEIQTEDILSDANIIRLVQEDARDEDESSDSEDDTLVSPGDALKSLETWISFYEQQDDNEFHAKDLKLFKRYFKIIKWLEQQFRKQASIMDYFFSI